MYRWFGLVTPIVYLLLLLALWLSHVAGTEVLRWTLAVAAVADAFAYGLPSSVNGVPGTIEFFALRSPVPRAAQTTIPCQPLPMRDPTSALPGLSSGATT